jgi:poly-gamma-glutamate synthesis protein (capsule biosynthesis protein)
VEKPKPASKPEDSRPLVVLIGGDVNLGREPGQRILKEPSYNPLAKLRPWFDSADLVFVNLESQLSDQNGITQSPLNRLIFSGPPAGADALSRAGVHVVSLANNHAWDYGRSGFLETLDNLERAGVSYVGASREAGRQYRPAVVEKRGYRVALFGVTAIWNQGPFAEHPAHNNVAWADYYPLHKELETIREKAEIVLVSYHGGGEYLDRPLGKTREFVRAVMHARVDALIGHHPHVMQGVGWFEGLPAFYSLGNLVFNQHKDHFWTKLGFLARLSFDSSGLIKTEGCPYQIEDLEPEPLAADGPLFARFIRRLEYVSTSVKGSRLAPPGHDGCFEISPP